MIEESSRTYKLVVSVMGAALLITPIFLIYFLCVLWPEAGSDDPNTMDWNAPLSIFGYDNITIGSNVRLLLLVVVTGTLGSCVHAATSFATFVGNRSIRLSWTWWYVLRPVIGMSLAVLFYFVIRGGLLATGSGASDVDPFGVAAVAGLVGMFSKQAADKLKELFDNLFKTEKGDELRADKLGEMLPVRDVMIGITQIRAVRIPEGRNEDNINLANLVNQLEGHVTRILVFTHENVVKYVIHQSMLYKFIAERNMQAGPETPFDLNTATLSDFLQYDNMRDLTESIAFVSVNAMLADAKQAMENKENCQDVFVTETGGDGEPVKGWLTNVDIAKHIKV